MTSHIKKPSNEYQELVTAGKANFDAAQDGLLAELDKLSSEMAWYGKSVPNKGLKKVLQKRSEFNNPPKGIYIYGDVGRGKSFLMDIFFRNTGIEKKVRIHFNAFMRNFHHRIHELKKESGGIDDDLVFKVASEIAAEYRLVCLDEMQIGDVAEALIIRRMLSWLLGQGVVMVFTSNRAPKELYLDVFQRDRFEELVDMIHQNFRVLKLEAAGDYRLSRLKSIDRVYFTPLGESADSFINDVFLLLTNGHAASHGKLAVDGHDFEIPMFYGDVAKFSFADLCEKSYGTADYTALSRQFNAVIVSGVPKLSAQQSNEARRFISFIDELYENRVKLVCSAEVEPGAIYTEGTASFEFKRTASRLIEMQTEEYLKQSKRS